MYSEWKGLVEGAKLGDENLKLEIIDRLTPLIISNIKRYYNKKEDYEELIQEGKECILECIKNFDKSKGVYFLGFVKLQLKYLYIGKHKIRQHISLNIEVGDEAKEEMINLIPSSLEELDQGIVDYEMQKVLMETLQVLTCRQRQVIVLYYVEKFSINQVAQSLGVKYRTVVNTKTTALGKLRNELKTWEPNC